METVETNSYCLFYSHLENTNDDILVKQRIALIHAYYPLVFLAIYSEAGNNSEIALQGGLTFPITRLRKRAIA